MESASRDHVGPVAVDPASREPLDCLMCDNSNPRVESTAFSDRKSKLFS